MKKCSINTIVAIMYNKWKIFKCDQETIWGVRFECIDCENYDLCEACFDLTLSEKKIHNIEHNFRAIEIPAFAEGIPCHDAKYYQ